MYLGSHKKNIISRPAKDLWCWDLIMKCKVCCYSTDVYAVGATDMNDCNKILKGYAKQQGNHGTESIQLRVADQRSELTNKQVK